MPNVHLFYAGLCILEVNENGVVNGGRSYILYFESDAIQTIGITKNLIVEYKNEYSTPYALFYA